MVKKLYFKVKERRKDYKTRQAINHLLKIKQGYQVDYLGLEDKGLFITPFKPRHSGGVAYIICELESGEKYMLLTKQLRNIEGQQVEVVEPPAGFFDAGYHNKNTFIKGDDSLKDAAIRETLEETGFDLTTVNANCRELGLKETKDNFLAAYLFNFKADKLPEVNADNDEVIDVAWILLEEINPEQAKVSFQGNNIPIKYSMDGLHIENLRKILKK